ncbi:MAG: helix-turn-helix domain-containing protein [Salinivirgaceae bacterium]|jgi:AraC-like DNA-binding protein|nr:helix-turn-helix domain-containing protein [Salinivirgaceae bacterium]
MFAQEFFRFFYILGFVNALFFSILIFTKKEKSQADKILGSWFIALAIQLLWPFFYLSDIDKYINMIGWEATLITLHPIFLYLYIKVLTGTSLSKKQIISNFWPVLIAIVAMSPFLFISQQQRKLLIAGEYIPLSLVPGFTLVVVVIVIFTILGFKILKKHKNQTLHVFSYSDNVDLLWLRRLIITSSALLALSVPIGLILYFLHLSLAFTDYIYYTTLVGFIFFMGYWGYQQGTIFNLHQPVSDEPEKLKIINDSEFQYRKDANDLKILMTKEKPFLDPTLTIHQLANQINLPSHQLSKVIHKGFQKNFFEFINEYRINYFKKLANAPKYKNFTILGIAFESGFNSKSAFNRIFKEQTGQTPGEFKKQKIS